MKGNISDYKRIKNWIDGIECREIELKRIKKYCKENNLNKKYWIDRLEEMNIEYKVKCLLLIKKKFNKEYNLVE